MRWLGIGPALLPASVGAGLGNLQPFHDCQDLRDWTVDAWVEALVRSAYDGGVVIDDRTDVAAQSGGGAEPGWSQTNVQVPGVDEPDIVETDGAYLYVVRPNELDVLDATPPEDLGIADVDPLSGYGLGFFLDRDRGLLLSMPRTNTAWTRAEILDLASPARPALAHRVDVEGAYVDARRMGDDAYLVVSTWIEPPQDLWEVLLAVDLPALDPNATPAERADVYAEARDLLRPYVEDVVAGLDDADLLPGEIVDGVRQPLLHCDCVYHPPLATPSSLVSIVHLDLVGDTPPNATGMYAEGWTVYASRDSLYVATVGGGWTGDVTRPETRLHRFALDGPTIAYGGSGRVPGWLLGRYAMDEEGGVLRVATNEWGDGGTTTSIYTLEPRDGALRRVGALRGISPGEALYAVRFLGDTAWLVTFEQIDPLIAVDLSDPTAPFVAGQLEVTGWSSYLHPAGDGRLVAVGMDGAQPGVVTDLSLSLYDVNDLSMPRLIDRETAASGGSWSEALWDPHAFLLYGSTLAMPIYGWDQDRTWSGLAVYDFDPDAGFTYRGRVEHGDLSPDCQDPSQPCTAVAQMRRAVVIGDALYSVSDLGVKASSLTDPSQELGRVSFDPAGSTPRR